MRRWKQFLDARNVKKEVNATRERSGKPGLVDLRYGFYVAMGGFVYVLDDLAERPENSLMTLTAKGAITLARQGYFVDIDPHTIEEKSKADILTKSLICIQVSWMVIQCIARAAAGYPLTLVELHVMVHVVCALSMYALWWKVGIEKSFSGIEILS